SKELQLHVFTSKSLKAIQTRAKPATGQRYGSLQQVSWPTRLFFHASPPYSPGHLLLKGASRCQKSSQSSPQVFKNVVNDDGESTTTPSATASTSASPGTSWGSRTLP